jgi:hypothetical protein
MNNKIFISLIFFFAILIGCSKDTLVSPELTPGKQESVSAKAGGQKQILGKTRGAVQVSGVGFYAANW